MNEIFSGISVSAEVHGGEPVISGTRVSVDVILNELSSGMPVDEVARQYRITSKNVLDCIQFAREQLKRFEFITA